MARHPNRPTFLDIALNISDKASLAFAGWCGCWLRLLLGPVAASGCCRRCSCRACCPTTRAACPAQRARGRSTLSTPRTPHTDFRTRPPAAPPLQFVELHGDRGGLDDPAMVCGLASIDGVSFMFIGHQKGRNTKVGCGPRVRWCGAGRACRGPGGARAWGRAQPGLGVQRLAGGPQQGGATPPLVRGTLV